MPLIAGLVVADPAGEEEDPEAPGVDAAAEEAGATDFAVSVVLLLPTVEVPRTILSAFTGGTGAKTLAALTPGVAGVAGAGEEMAAPAETGLPMLAMVGVPGTPVPKTGDVGNA